MPRTKSEPEKIGVKTKDLMEVPPVTVMESATIDEAAAVMWDQNIGSVIVVNQAGVMAGILTERDVLYAVTKSLTSRGVPVSSVMSKTSLIASPNEGVLTAVERMLKSGVRHLPVVDKEGTPVGMISMRDAIDLSEPLLKMVLGTVHRKKTTTASPKP